MSDARQGPDDACRQRRGCSRVARMSLRPHVDLRGEAPHGTRDHTAPDGTVSVMVRRVLSAVSVMNSLVPSGLRARVWAPVSGVVSEVMVRVRVGVGAVRSMTEM